jgi:hypothetical protein
MLVDRRQATPQAGAGPFEGAVDRRTLVVSDACSTTSESAHNAALESLTMLAEIVPTAGLLASLT